MSAPITLTGRLGSDPELRFAPSGTAIASLRVVTDRRVKEGDEWKSVETTWWQVTAFKALAERIVERLAKGDPVVVIGRVKSREWEDAKTGEKRQAMEVVADTVCLDLSRVKDSAPAPKPGASDDPWATPAPSQGDIPF